MAYIPTTERKVAVLPFGVVFEYPYLEKMSDGTEVLVCPDNAGNIARISFSLPPSASAILVKALLEKQREL